MPDNNSIRIARPIFAIDGQDDASLSEGLLSLLIVEHFDGLYRCETTLGNWGSSGNGLGYLYFDRKKLDFGKSLQVKIGSSVMFEGRIMGLEANYPDDVGPQLNILAEDRFQDLRMTRRTRTFNDVSDADVIRQIADEHGIRANVSVAGPTYTVLAQINQSDLAFIRERARASGVEVWMDSATLNAKSRLDRNGQTLELSYKRELHEFSVLADIARQRTSVTVNGWDVAGKTALTFEASDSILSGELSSDASGASILSTALGERKEAIVHTVPLTSQEAQAEAESFFRRDARRFVVGRGIAQTDPLLRVGNYVDLKDLGPLFSGKYYLSEVRHLFDGVHGIRTEFTAERPGLGRP